MYRARATNTMLADWDSWFAPVDTDPALHSHRMKLLLNGQLCLSPNLWTSKMLLPAAEGCLGLMDKTRIQRLRSTSAFRALVVEHEIATLVGQRVLGIALGYEDLNDHDELRYYPITGTSTSTGWSGGLTLPLQP
jgi:hypothetical protein